MNDNKKWDAGRLMKLSGISWQSFTLQAGVGLGIFTEIGGRSAVPAELVERLQLDCRALTMLLNALAAMGLLIKKDDTYENTAESKRFLVEGSPDYVGYMIGHFHHTASRWISLSQSVTTGEPVRKSREMPEKERESFLMGMHNLASAIAREVASVIDLSGCGSIIDMGGGPGTHAVHFCRANPKLKATIYDLPETGPYANKVIQAEGLSDRVSFLAGNYLTDELPGSYDAAWLSQILHGEGPDDCIKIINKVVSSLSAGGKIMIHDFILNDSHDGPLFPAIFSLNMLINTPHGQSYSESEIREMLAEAGVENVSRLPFKGNNDSGIITGSV